MSKPLERQDWLEPDALDRFEQESDQGKAWTRLVTDYFQSQGHPLPRKSSG